MPVLGTGEDATQCQPHLGAGVILGKRKQYGAAVRAALLGCLTPWEKSSSPPLGSCCSKGGD